MKVRSTGSGSASSGRALKARRNDSCQSGKLGDGAFPSACIGDALVLGLGVHITASAIAMIITRCLGHFGHLYDDQHAGIVSAEINNP